MSLTAQEMIRPRHDLLEPHASRRALLVRRLVDLERRIAEYQGTIGLLQREHAKVRAKVISFDPQQPPRG